MIITAGFPAPLRRDAQYAPHWSLLLALVVHLAGGLGQDAALRDEHHLAAAELLLQLAHQPRLDLLVGPHLRHRHEHHDRLQPGQRRRGQSHSPGQRYCGQSHSRGRGAAVSHTAGAEAPRSVTQKGQRRRGQSHRRGRDAAVSHTARAEAPQSVTQPGKRSVSHAVRCRVSVKFFNLC